MSEEVRIALIASGSALLGAVVGMLGNVVAERQRAVEARRSRVEERLLQAMVDFDTAAVEWSLGLQALPTSEDPRYEAAHTELEERAERLRGAGALLDLVAPDDVAEWVQDEYRPIQHELADAARGRALGRVDAAAVENAAAAYREAHRELRVRCRGAAIDLRIAHPASRRKRAPSS